MTIYIDEEFKCHKDDDGNMEAVETDFFDGKCKEFIEGFRFVPYGKSWTSSSGIVTEGEAAMAWTNFEELYNKQLRYDAKRARILASENASLMDAMATLVDEVYTSDTEMMGL